MSGYSSRLLEDRTVLVTGAGKGIGRACVEEAVKCGASVIAVARTASDLDDLVASGQGRVQAWAQDVTSKDFLERLEALDHLDGLVNNVGTNRTGPMSRQTEADLDAVVDLNVKTPWLVSRAALTPLRKSASASIVNMSSQMGHVGSPERTLYCMSKHAVEGLTKAMAVELAEEKIRVNSVAPTFVRTPLTEPMLQDQDFSNWVHSMIPMGELATPEQVAMAVIFLLSNLSGSTTGTSLKVDGGWTAR